VEEKIRQEVVPRHSAYSNLQKYETEKEKGRRDEGEGKPPVDIKQNQRLVTLHDFRLGNETFLII